MNISLNFLSKLRITMLLRAHLELAILLFDLLGGGGGVMDTLYYFIKMVVGNNSGFYVNEFVYSAYMTGCDGA